MKEAKINAVKFSDLGCIFYESSLWLEFKAPGGSFGYIVDFFTVIEHIYQ